MLDTRRLLTVSLAALCTLGVACGAAPDETEAPMAGTAETAAPMRRRRRCRPPRRRRPTG